MGAVRRVRFSLWVRMISQALASGRTALCLSDGLKRTLAVLTFKKAFVLIQTGCGKPRARFFNRSVEIKADVISQQASGEILYTTMITPV